MESNWYKYTGYLDLETAVEEGNAILKEVTETRCAYEHKRQLLISTYLNTLILTMQRRPVQWHIRYKDDFLLCLSIFGRAATKMGPENEFLKYLDELWFPIQADQFSLTIKTPPWAINALMQEIISVVRTVEIEKKRDLLFAKISSPIMNVFFLQPSFEIQVVMIEAFIFILNKVCHDEVRKNIIIQITQDFKIHRDCFYIFLPHYLHWDKFPADITRQVVRDMNEINLNNKIFTLSLNDLKINNIVITPYEKEQFVYLNFNLAPESISLLIQDSELKMLLSEAKILNKYEVVYIYFKDIQYITHRFVNSNSFSIEIVFTNCTTMCHNENECRMSHCTENKNKITFFVAEEEFHKFLKMLKAFGIYSKLNERYLQGIYLQNNAITTVTDTEPECFLQKIFIRQPKEIAPINPPKRRRISTCSIISTNSIRRRRIFNDSYIDLEEQPEPKSFALRFNDSQPIRSANISLEIINTTLEDSDESISSSPMEPFGRTTVSRQPQPIDENESFSPKTPRSYKSFGDSIKSSTPKTPSSRRDGDEILKLPFGSPIASPQSELCDKDSSFGESIKSFTPKTPSSRRGGDEILKLPFGSPIASPQSELCDKDSSFGESIKSFTPKTPSSRRGGDEILKLPFGSPIASPQSELCDNDSSFGESIKSFMPKIPSRRKTKTKLQKTPSGYNTRAKLTKELNKSEQFNKNTSDEPIKPSTPKTPSSRRGGDEILKLPFGSPIASPQSELCDNDSSFGESIKSFMPKIPSRRKTKTKLQKTPSGYNTRAKLTKELNKSEQFNKNTSDEPIKSSTPKTPSSRRGGDEILKLPFGWTIASPQSELCDNDSSFGESIKSFMQKTPSSRRDGDEILKLPFGSPIASPQSELCDKDSSFGESFKSFMPKTPSRRKTKTKLQKTPSGYNTRAKLAKELNKSEQFNKNTSDEPIKPSTPKTPSRRRTSLELLLESPFESTMYKPSSCQKKISSHSIGTTENKRKQIKKGDLDSPEDFKGYAGNDININNANRDKFISHLQKLITLYEADLLDQELSITQQSQSRIVQIRSQDCSFSSIPNSNSSNKQKQFPGPHSDVNLNGGSSASLILERELSESKFAKYFHIYTPSEPDSPSTENIDYESYSQRLKQLYAQVDKIKEAAGQINHEELNAEHSRAAFIYLNLLHEFLSEENKRYKKIFGQYDDMLKDLLSKF